MNKQGDIFIEGSHHTASEVSTFMTPSSNVSLSSGKVIQKLEVVGQIGGEKKIEIPFIGGINFKAGLEIKYSKEEHREGK